MDPIARKLLEKLAAAGTKADAGVRSRAPALTRSHLSPYLQLRSLQQKESFETTMLSARGAGAVELVWERANPKDGFIERIDLVDLRALSAFIGEVPLSDRLAAAAEALSELTGQFPVLRDVLGRWAQVGKVRGIGPDGTQEWIDAARVVAFAAGNTSDRAIALPLREASAQLFGDSKRIERLTAPMDVLLAGSIEAMPRAPVDVWQEIGLFREEQPALLAGKVVVERLRVTSLLDAPYSGLPAKSVLRLASAPQSVMSIENLTTFHSEARRRCDDEVLLLYTGGMPSPAWRGMYVRLLTGLPAGTPVFHWGDLDEGGFRIAAFLAKEARSAGQELLPWSMHPDDVPEADRRAASPKTIERMQHFARAAGWGAIGEAISVSGFTVEQEAL